MRPSFHSNWVEDRKVPAFEGVKSHADTEQAARALEGEEGAKRGRGGSDGHCITRLCVLMQPRGAAFPPLALHWLVEEARMRVRAHVWAGGSCAAVSLSHRGPAWRLCVHVCVRERGCVHPSISVCLSI